MTSVNSPACLLARNHFYKNLPSSPEPSPAAFTCQNDSVSQRQVTLWVTMATPPALSGGIENKSLCINIVLGFPSSRSSPTSKPSSPAEWGGK
ncbi:hypothetical protein JOB18_037771 [Solea senegalensis]|uniref:Uncharacterized protein n=1 Tax=Solea senegalensis TaxID=28829 RepID=A0AAV6SUW5_SOLSE|nr:hypothetical protein JOB18_037771 [Solea senegalensis]KAG7520878.1 hypothetical protein JOB18_037771 [Solea senegalensis]KAG7520879.1 hypothetical protein JOB18_037771 [Solea senegalensis]KAG7520880.1 hypothetical protein JOB18_037771 [Solea senegalensis]